MRRAIVLVALWLAACAGRGPELVEVDPAAMPVRFSAPSLAGQVRQTRGAYGGPGVSLKRQLIDGGTVFALVDFVRVETSGSGFAEARQVARFREKLADDWQPVIESRRSLVVENDPTEVLVLRSDPRQMRCVGVSRFRDKLLERGASGELYRVRVDVLYCRSGQRRHELEDPELVASWIDF